MLQIIYNTTFVIEEKIKDDFLRFIKEIYIPGVLAHGILSDARLMRVVSTPTEDPTLSYALQFVAPNQRTLSTYLEEQGRIYPEKLVRLFGQSVMGFSTFMELEEL
ncbi:MAG: DUF4286 family protein [Porphyromonadaceae bacterium]|nr:DUF4286 family protein [Porphyromonadaceae bacterium]